MSTMTTKRKLLAPLIAAVAVGILFSAVTAGVLISQQTIDASGSIKNGGGGGGVSDGDSGGGVSGTVNIGVYSDALATTRCASIDWGEIVAGGSVSRSVFVKNTGTSTLKLSASASSWSPSGADSVLSFSWNREGEVLAPGATVTATFTLHASSDTGALENFSLDIKVSGSG
ncbi:MAG: hypothetical protein NWE93_03630 [Candidatus Bathyarchaeota archaeon]|nr:hypothetical protein [Candidatus Bathyarchaeota archaeon]